MTVISDARHSSTSPRRGPLLVFLLGLLLASAHGFAADRVTYDEFLRMDAPRKEAAVRRHVRKEGRYYALSYGQYIIYTDKSPLYALEMTVLMDDFYHRFHSIFDGKFERSDQPRVYILGDRNGYRNALTEVMGGGAPAWSAGLYVPREKALLADGSYGEDALRDILFHEGTHQLLHAYTDEMVAIWLNEGLATNFESWELHRSHEANIANAIYASRRIGGVAASYPDKGFVPFRRLARMSFQGWGAASNPGPNYASAWVTTYFLLTCEDGRALLDRLIRAVREGEEIEDLIDERLATRIQAKVNDFVEQRILPNLEYGRTIQALILKGNLEKARVGTAQMLKEYPESPEAQFFDAWLTAQSQGAGSEDVAKAGETLEALDSNKDFHHPHINFALAQYHSRAGNLKAAVACASDAVKDDLKSEAAVQLEADLQMRVDVATQGEKILRYVARRNLSHAYRLAGDLRTDHPEALGARFFYTWLSITAKDLEGGALSNAIATLEELRKDADFAHPQLAFALAQGCAKAGRYEDAIRYAREALATNPDHGSARRVLRYAKAKSDASE